MALCTQCLRRVARAPIQRAQWHQISRRFYSDDVQQLLTTYDEQGDPEWFQKLRHEMLNRELPILRDQISNHQESKLVNSLSDFLPAEWAQSLVSKKPPAGKPPGSVGNHLIFFNPALPAKELLPDGTDPLQSPGDPFVRRMWAGGAVRVNMAQYRDSVAGWGIGHGAMCAERIKDVQLRGQGEAAKIFVTIERRFARLSRLLGSMQETGAREGGVDAFYQQQVRQAEDWGDAFLTEDRNLVFMHERSMAELEDLKAGKMAAVKYLTPPVQPEFSHALIPTSSLLFRFSALTFNAHAIHLDREYCRTVEGHRNLLVHGPLTLLLMIKLISSHLYSLPDPPQIVQAIEYRNLAPLYCDEELRLCASEKQGLRSDDGRIYDVWIQGPTGGVAVKGMIKTAAMPTREVSKTSGQSQNRPADAKGLKDQRSKDTDPTHRFSTNRTKVRRYASGSVIRKVRDPN